MKLKILFFEPGEKPYEKDIEDDIEAMQSVVGGSIEAVNFDPKRKAVAWCNDEFLLNGSRPNRMVGGVVIHGTFYICGNTLGAEGWTCCSLSSDQINRYKKFADQLFLDCSFISAFFKN